MKVTTVVSCAILLTGVSGKEEVKRVCGNERLGELNDSLSYYPNAWNKKSPKNGFVCLKVDNSTPAFSATWNWPADIQDVHSFPYVRFNNPSLPVRLSDLESIRLSTDWIYTPGSPSKIPDDFSNEVWTKNKAELEGDGVQANAAWDFFLDDNRNRTLYPQVAKIEFMVWLGRVGDPWWLGRQNDSILSTVTLGETEFLLFYGRNSGGTHVFTAVTKDNSDVLSFDEDFYPLFQYILKQAHKQIDADDLPKDPWLGIIEFGTETWMSRGNATFTAANFGMSLKGNFTSERNSTKDDGDKDKGDKSGDEKGGDKDGGDKGSGDNSTDSKGDEEDDAVRLMSQSVLGIRILRLVGRLQGSVNLPSINHQPTLFPHHDLHHHKLITMTHPSPSSRLQRAIHAVPFLLITAIMSRAFAMAKPIGPTIEETVKTSIFTAKNVTVPIIKSFYGVPVLDDVFAVVTVAFAHLQFFTDEEAYWQLLVFLTDFAGMYAVVMMEGYRPGNTFPVIKYPVVFLFLSQMFGIGCLAPIFFFLFYIFTPAYRLTTPSLYRPGVAPCLAILPTVVFGYYVTHFPSFFHSSLQGRNCWNWIWQLFPIWGSIIMLLLSKIIPQPKEQTPRIIKQEHNAIRLTIGVVSAISTATWWYTILNMDSTIFEVFIPQHFLTTPQDPILGLRTVIQFDYICCYAAGFLWLAYHFKDLENVGVCSISWIRAGCASVVLGCLLGPGTIFPLIWLLREELLVATQADEKKLEN
ncbi:hypothetical protein FPCIR_3308 [Fusarium pseudocircinatum]|uniref:Uncharacterized protein n=1 Tax=Fusarium pseudocircinatum TaxID=56676 RepID=A0A8H5PJK4_9HYPO|nr:hypothetical protein FPCIR_3308 [Fusarium pseudocircinatum]